jgi:hypothetical protein
MEYKTTDRGTRVAGDVVWKDTLREPFERDAWSITFQTNRGDIIARYYPVPASEMEVRGGVVWVSGGSGGFEGPRQSFYPEACRRLRRQGVAGLSLNYRIPNVLDECACDVLLGVKFLVREGLQRVVLVGHGFGGAVVIAAAPRSEAVTAVVALSTRSDGIELVPETAPRPILLIHGTNDQIVNDACSRSIYRSAREPKELKLYTGAGHDLDEVRDDLLTLLAEWIPRQLERKNV